MRHNWLVVICREGVSEVTPFANYDDAKEFFDKWEQQWSDSYLCKVEIGPFI